MSAFKKMSLVAAEELNRLKQKQLTAYNPELRSMVFLKDEMDRILTRNDLPADEKVKLFQVAQHRFDSLKLSVQQQPIAPAKAAAAAATAEGDGAQEAEEEQGSEIEAAMDAAPGPSTAVRAAAPFAAMVAALPKSFQKKGTEMVGFFDQNKDKFGIGPAGELAIDGHVIPHSNFQDLYRYLYSTKKEPPAGFDLFADALRDRNVSHSSISNRNALGHLDPFASPAAPPNLGQSGSGRARPPGKRPRILTLYKL